MFCTDRLVPRLTLVEVHIDSEISSFERKTLDDQSQNPSSEARTSTVSVCLQMPTVGPFGVPFAEQKERLDRALRPCVSTGARGARQLRATLVRRRSGCLCGGPGHPSDRAACGFEENSWEVLVENEQSRTEG